MALFAIADLHLSLGADKPMDVFQGWQDYVSRLEKNWRALVSPADTVVIPGDISWAMRLEDAATDFAFLHTLPGQKLLMKGNHDYWWSTQKKMDAFLEEKGFHSLQIVHNRAVRVGDVAVCGTRGWLYNAETPEDQKIVNREVGRLNASLDDAERLGGTPVVFLHYPPVYDGVACAEILETLERRNVRACYFGHIHGNQAARRAVTGVYRGIRMVLVSCDYLRFAPAPVQVRNPAEEMEHGLDSVNNS